MSAPTAEPKPKPKPRRPWWVIAVFGVLWAALMFSQQSGPTLNGCPTCPMLFEGAEANGQPACGPDGEACATE